MTASARPTLRLIVTDPCECGRSKPEGHRRCRPCNLALAEKLLGRSKRQGQGSTDQPAQSQPTASGGNCRCGFDHQLQALLAREWHDKEAAP